MASSSDRTAVRGFIPPQNDEERLLMRRVEELCRTATNRGIPRYTGFLSDRERVLAQAAVNKAGCDCVRFEGGYPDAERQVLCVEPPQAWQEEPLAVLLLRAMTLSGEKCPTHRDYLGSILGLGLERVCVGDILINPKNGAEAYVFVMEDKADFIMRELTSAGRCPVQVKRCDEIPAEILQGPERELRESTVSSLRADAVLGSMMHTSRTQAAELIAAGRVEVNHLPLKSAHEAVYLNDIFTVRGVGRFRLADIGGRSKKDRIFISFYQY